MVSAGTEVEHRGVANAARLKVTVKSTSHGHISTINGQLEADFNRISRQNPISLRSVNGPIKLSIPGGAGASVTARNLSGGIDSEFGRPFRATGGHRLQAMVHGGGAQIHLHNVNGGISIHTTWSRRAVRPVS